MTKITTWATHSAFLLAAIGAAVGIGNLWRFPYIMGENGGGAFFIPYLVALFTFGIPLLMAEFQMGRGSGLAAPGAFAWLKEKFEAFGWLAVLVTTVVGFYYAAVLSWAIQFLIAAFQVRWAGNESDFFYSDVLQLSGGAGEVTHLVWPLVIGVAILWTIAYFSLFKGVRLLGKIVKWTVWVPIGLLIVLAIRGLTLPGAAEGIAYYLTPNWEVLRDPQVWLAAYTQVLFSIGIGFGVMIVYSRHLTKRSDIVNNARIIGFANSAVSFLAGFAVFSTLGFLALQNSQTVAEVAASGPGLVFVAYPAALAQLPGAALFSVIFFITLLTLGIDSLYSIIETMKGALIDKGVDGKRATLILVIAGFLGSLFFVTDGGLYWLDIVDHWLINYGASLIALMECILIGWAVDIGNFRASMNEHSEAKAGKWWEICIKYISPAVLAVLIGQSLMGELVAPYGDYPQWALNLGGWSLTGLIFLAAIVLTKSKVRWELLSWYAFFVIVAGIAFQGYPAVAMGIFGGGLIFGGLWRALRTAKLVQGSDCH